jgi:hypothetical protein
MKHYLRFVLSAFIIVASLGYLLPALISYPDTMLVLAGIFYAVLLMPTALYYLNRDYIKSLINSIKGD